MNSSRSPTSEAEEETPQQRALRILNDSVAFRTSVVAMIHKEIHLLCWDGWLTHCDQVRLCKSRTGLGHMGSVRGTAVSIGPGHYRHMLQALKN